jgi:hypothetical protein
LTGVPFGLLSSPDKHGLALLRSWNKLNGFLHPQGYLQSKASGAEVLFDVAMLAPLRLGLVIVAHLYFASLVASFGFTNDEYDVRPGEPFNLKFECDIAYDAEISLVRLDLDTGAIEHDSTLLRMFHS